MPQTNSGKIRIHRINLVSAVVLLTLACQGCARTQVEPPLDITPAEATVISLPTMDRIERETALAPAQTLTPTAQASATLAPTFTATVLVPTPSPTATPPFSLPAYLQSGWIAFTNRGKIDPAAPDRGLYLVRPDGSEIRVVSTEGHIFRDLTWSPDGHWLAYVLVADLTLATPAQEIYIVNIDGTHRRRLTFDTPQNAYSPAWSPDGQYIAYILQSLVDGRNVNTLRVIHIEDGTIQALTSDNNARYPIWSRDGETLYYMYTQDDTSFLMAVGTDGSNRREIARMSIAPQTLSPDGKAFLLQNMLRWGCRYLGIMNLDDFSLVDLSDIKGNPAYPSWSPDPRFVSLFYSQKCDRLVGLGPDDGWQLHILDLQDHTLHLVSEQLDTSYDLEYSVWSPVPALQTGQQYIVTGLGDQTRLRVKPSTQGSVLRWLAAGESITILEGPVDTEDYYWWRVQTEDGLEGWVIEIAWMYTLVE